VRVACGDGGVGRGGEVEGVVLGEEGRGEGGGSRGDDGEGEEGGRVSSGEGVGACAVG
jgi:hypothetical protein